MALATADPDTGLMRISDLARELEVKESRVRYLVRSQAVRPARIFPGARQTYLFGREAIPVIAGAMLAAGNRVPPAVAAALQFQATAEAKARRRSIA